MNSIVHFIVPVVILKLVIITANKVPNIDPCINKTMSQVIMEKCPLVAYDNEFKSQTFLNNCSNWCKIDNTNTLTGGNENDVLCLLYYDAFVPFCQKLIKNGIKNVTVVPPNLNYTVERLCSKLAILPNDEIHNLKQMIKLPVFCDKLCIDYNGTVRTQCNLAYYFSSLDLNSTLSIQHELKIETSSRAANINSISNGVSAETNHVIHQLVNLTKEKLPASVENSEKLPFVDKEGIPSAAPPSSSEINMPEIHRENPISNEVPPMNAAVHPTSVQTIVSKQSPIKEIPHADPGTLESAPKSAVENPVNAIDLESDNDGKDDNNVNENEDTRYGQNSPEQDTADNEAYDEEAKASVPNEKKKEKPVTVDDEPANYNNTEVLDGESYFFSYFMAVCVLFVLGYVVYHNRTKVFALVLEGKRGKRQYRGRRPNSANYHKLDSNLEEAISSSCTKNSSHVIY